MWHRCLGKADKTVEAWEQDNLQSYDKAGKGKSALTVAALLSLKTEIVTILKYFITSAFHEINKFFDSVDPDILFKAVIDEGFPKGTFVLAMAQHMAPRIILFQSYSSSPIWISVSILAGCFVAVALARVFTRRVLTSIKDVNPKVDLDMYIDDANQYVVTPNYEDTMEPAHDATTDFAVGADNLKLLLSENAGLVSNPLWLASSSPKHLRVKAIYMKNQTIL